MKRIYIILAALSILAVSCNREVEFQHETFVTFDTASYSVSEGIGELRIPVSVYNPTGQEINVTVMPVDGSEGNGAVEGVNYEIKSPESGILTFSGETVEQEIVVELIPVDGLTGTKAFSLQIASATRGINVGGFNEVQVKILDDDHPLAAFIGEWTGSMIESYSGMTYNTNFTIEAIEGNFSKLLFSAGIDPMFAEGSEVKFTASVAADEEGVFGNVVSIASKQLNGYESCFISALEETTGGYWDFADEILFELSGTTLTQKTHYGVVVPNEAAGGYGLYSIYMSGATFTKK